MLVRCARLGIRAPHAHRLLLRTARFESSVVLPSAAEAASKLPAPPAGPANGSSSSGVGGGSAPAAPLPSEPAVASAPSEVIAAVTSPDVANAAPELVTVPVPTLVGPLPSPLPGPVPAASGASGEAAADGLQAAYEAASAVAPSATASTAGGWFFGKPMAVVEALLIGVHDMSGLPWWQVIGLTTIGVRLLFFPLQIFQSRNIARMAAIKPQIDELSTRMRESARQGDDEGIKQAEKARLELSALMSHHNVRPWLSIVGALGQVRETLKRTPPAGARARASGPSPPEPPATRAARRRPLARSPNPSAPPAPPLSCRCG